MTGIRRLLRGDSMVVGRVYTLMLSIRAVMGRADMGSMVSGSGVVSEVSAHQKLPNETDNAYR
jgi:hypothetical protein